MFFKSDMLEWQKGIPLGQLKSVCHVFQEYSKPYTFGAFGRVTERDIAIAMSSSKNGVELVRNGSAIAIVSILSSTSIRHDFVGDPVRFAKGTCWVHAIVGEFEDQFSLLSGLLKPASDIIVEGYIEDPLFLDIMERLGFGRCMVQISASSDMKGLYARGHNAFVRSYPRHEQVGVAVLQKDYLAKVEAETILNEAKKFGQWADHYSSYNKRHSWSAVALCGYDFCDPSFIIKPAEMSKRWKRGNIAYLDSVCTTTLAAKHFPVAMSVAKRIPGKKQRVRLMRLSASGGELTRHSDITDKEAGAAIGKLARLHIPIVTSRDCLFRSWWLDGKEHQFHLPELALCYLDTRKPHAVVNNGKSERIHLVVDTFVTPELQELIGAVWKMN
jgi:hypothetical protein